MSLNELVREKLKDEDNPQLSKTSSFIVLSFFPSFFLKFFYVNNCIKIIKVKNHSIGYI